ncbi:MAG: hypothetical protein KatS3mg113_0868 [Planctomycetaceae bacterium]|nr:MAG: hypothetical protein KatS3mg113_0868 [Planctomycetaceae bacterium]
MAVFESHTPLMCSPQELFDFLILPKNLEELSEDDQLVLISAPEKLSLGASLVFEIRGFGLVKRVEHAITRFDPPRGFREEMVSGPLQHWQHDYILEPLEPRGVTLINRIEFTPPSGFLGLILNEKRLLDHLADVHAQRQQALRSRWGALP